MTSLLVINKKPGLGWLEELPFRLELCFDVF